MATLDISDLVSQGGVRPRFAALARAASSRQRAFQPAFSQANQGVVFGAYIDQPGYRPRWAPAVRGVKREGRVFQPGWGQGTQAVPFPLRIAQPGYHPRWAPVARGLRHSVIAMPGWGQANQGVSFPLFTRQDGFSPKWTPHILRIHSRKAEPGWGQGNQGVQFPLFLGQAGYRPRWAPVARGGYRGRPEIPGLGQQNQGGKFPLFIRQAGFSPHWNPIILRAIRSRRADNAWYKVAPANPPFVTSATIRPGIILKERLGALRRPRPGRVFMPPLRSFSNPADWTARRYSSRHLRYPLLTRSAMRRTFVPRWVTQTAPSFSGIGTLTASAVITESQGLTISLSASGTLAIQMYEFYVQAPTALDYRPADHTLVLNQGYDLGEQAQCVLGRGSNVPAGSTNFGFVDTTYSLTKAQILAGANNSAF